MQSPRGENDVEAVPMHPGHGESTSLVGDRLGPLTSSSQRVSSLRRSRFGEADCYDEIRQIGSGGFGNCFLLERRRDNALRVCKVQKRDYYPEVDDYEEAPIEADILLNILPPHDRILRLHDIIIHSHTVQLYYDFYAGGDLKQLIDSYEGQWQKVPEEFLWHAYQQITEALAYIHHGYDKRAVGPPPKHWTSIIHGDVKDRNIFLGPPNTLSNDSLAREYPSLILGDFGLADIRPSRRWGTPVWQAPELPMLSKKSDVWGAGAVIHALAHEGKPPILELSGAESDDTWDDWCENPASRQAIPLSPTYSRELEICVSHALEFDPVRRYDSLKLHSEVTAVWNVNGAPYVGGGVTPLIQPAAYKEYDENGVTIRSTEYSTAREGIDASSTASQADTVSRNRTDPSLHDLVPLPVTEIPVDPTILTRSSVGGSAIEQGMIFEQAHHDDVLQSIQIRAHNLPYRINKRFGQDDSSSTISPMPKRRKLSPISLPMLQDRHASRRDHMLNGHATSAFESHSVTATTYNGMVYDMNGVDYDYGASQIVTTPRGFRTDPRNVLNRETGFQIDGTGWCIDLGERKFVFGANPSASSIPASTEAGSVAFPVDLSSWCTDPAQGMSVFGSTTV